MYLKSAWRALGKMYYHALQIGNAKEFELDGDEKEDVEAVFKAQQLLKITGHLKQVAELYEYLGKKVVKSGKLYKKENGCYSINGSDFYYEDGSLIEYYDINKKQYEISKVCYAGDDFFIDGYLLPMQYTKVRVRGYQDEK